MHKLSKEEKTMKGDQTGWVWSVPLKKMEEYEAMKFLDQENKKSGQEGALEYKTTQTGIGLVIEVRHSITKAEKNITDYERW